MAWRKDGPLTSTVRDRISTLLSFHGPFAVVVRIRDFHSVRSKRRFATTVALIRAETRRTSTKFRIVTARQVRTHFARLDGRPSTASQRASLNSSKSSRGSCRSEGSPTKVKRPQWRYSMQLQTALHFSGHRLPRVPISYRRSDCHFDGLSLTNRPMGSVSLSREAIELASSTPIPIDYNLCHITLIKN